MTNDISFPDIVDSISAQHIAILALELIRRGGVHPDLLARLLTDLPQLRTPAAQRSFMRTIQKAIEQGAPCQPLLH